MANRFKHTSIYLIILQAFSGVAFADERNSAFQAVFIGRADDLESRDELALTGHIVNPHFVFVFVGDFGCDCQRGLSGSPNGCGETTVRWTPKTRCRIVLECGNIDLDLIAPVNAGLGHEALRELITQLLDYVCRPLTV